MVGKRGILLVDKLPHVDDLPDSGMTARQQEGPMTAISENTLSGIAARMAAMRPLTDELARHRAALDAAVEKLAARGAERLSEGKAPAADVFVVQCDISGAVALCEEKDGNISVTGLGSILSEKVWTDESARGDVAAMVACRLTAARRKDGNRGVLHARRLHVALAWAIMAHDRLAAKTQAHIAALEQAELKLLREAREVALRALRVLDEEFNAAASKGSNGRPGVAALNRIWEHSRAAREALES